jgi:hypothetical protein
MYWIYLILFTLIVFVPTSIRGGFYIFDATQTQEFVILFLGSIGFSLFLLMEKKFKKNLEEKNKIQGQVNSMTKDLKYSYSYIGEINRKLDILENIALGYPESTKVSETNENELYNAIMDATGLFGKSDDFAIRFISLYNFEILHEIKSIPESTISFELKTYDAGINYLESDECIVINSPKSIDNTLAYIVLKKKMASHRLEDIEIMKTLAAQALFIFVFMRNKRQITCVA